LLLQQLRERHAIRAFRSRNQSEMIAEQCSPRAHKRVRQAYPKWPVIGQSRPSISEEIRGDESCSAASRPGSCERPERNGMLLRDDS
jgi:hypothetical protein